MPMITSILRRLDAIDTALDTALDESADADTRAAARNSIRSNLRTVERDLAAVLDIDGAVIEVEDDHESYAIAAVTAYLDGASRGDGFELLGETVSGGVVSGGRDLRWFAGVIAALARLSGDLAVLSASSASQPEWQDALAVIQRLARRGGR